MKKSRRKCKYCKEWYEPKFSSTEPCPNYECRLLCLEANKPKIEKGINKLRKAQKRAEKESIIDYSKALQKEVQLIARLIDYKCLCLARNIIPIKSDGGHLFSRGGNVNIKYNLHNIFLQSAASNHFQNDDGLMRDGVVRVFGVDYLEFITSLKQTEITKYSNEEYKAILANARVISRRLKEENKDLITFRTPKERINLRNKINIELGIYSERYCIYNQKAE